MRFPLCALLAAFLLSASPMLAQADKQAAPPSSPSPPAVTYKLTFTVRQLIGGKTAESRAYSALFESSLTADSFIRAGDRIPVSGSLNQYNYQDVGINIDFRALPNVRNLTPRQIAIDVSAEVSESVDLGKTPGRNPPIIRQDKWDSHFIVELGKPTLLFSSDDPTLDRTTQIELTAVKMP